MAKKRFNLMETMEEVNNFIQTPKGEKNETNGLDGINGTNGIDGVNGLNKANGIDGMNGTNKQSAESDNRVGEYDPTVPDTKYKRNITLSEELLWRLNYIKDRRNKSRAKGEKFTSIDQLMFEMVQFALDEKFGSTKRKFLESKEDEEEFN